MLARLSDIDRRAFREGARDYSPTLMAIFSWGLVTGIAMSKSVLTLPQALTMSLLCYAGSSQLAVLPLLAAKQRATDPHDWMSTDTEIACPDPHCSSRLRITRLGKRRFSHAQTTAVPLPHD